MKTETSRWLALLLFLVGCDSGAQPERAAEEVFAAPSSVLSVYVVNYPLQYFAGRIGGDEVSVSLPVPAGVDPAYWSPVPEVVAAYQSADLVLLNGAGYAKWIQLVSLPQAKLVDTSATFRDRFLPLAAGPVHTHGPEGEHSHAGYAFTTWLDPTLAIEHARAIAAAFSRARPERSEAFQRALDDLETDLTDLDRQLAATWSLLDGRPVLFSHPVYQYLERRYGLDGASVHWEPREAPDEDMWRELGALRSDHAARWMIWESAPLEATKARLAAMGVGCLVYSPLAGVPDAGDLLTGMRGDLSAIAIALEGDRP